MKARTALVAAGGGGRPSTFQGRDNGVERGRIGRLGRGIVAISRDGKRGQRPPPCGAEQRQLIARQPDRPAGVNKDLARHGVQRPDLDRLGAGHLRGKPAGDAG